LRLREQSFEIGFVTTRRRSCTRCNASWKQHPRTVEYCSSSCARRSGAATSWSRREPTTRRRFVTYHTIKSCRTGCFRQSLR